MSTLGRFSLMAMSKYTSDSGGNSAKTLAPRALQSILVGALPFGLVYLSVVIPLFVARKAAAAAMWAGIMVIALTCMVLLRRGYVRLSSWIFLSSAWLVLSTYIALSGGIESPALLSHIAVVVVAAWLVGPRVAVGIAVVSLLSDLSLAIPQHFGWQASHYFPTPPMVAWIIAAALVSLAILPLASVNQALADSAEQARRELEARRLEEQARAESDERFRATFFQAAVGITQTGIDGSWLLMNDRLCQILGYSPAELRGKTFLDLTHPDDLEISRTAKCQLVSGEIPSWSVEKRYIRKDGTTVWARVFTSMVRDRDGKPQYFITVVEDITERKQAEATLRESEERFRNMADSAPVMIWVSGLDKLCTFFNKPWLDFTGRAMAQELGDGWFAGVHPEDLERCLEVYNSAFDARRPFQMQYRLRHADGDYRWVLDHGTPLYRAGEFAGFIGSCIDITEQKLMAERLQDQTVQFVDAQRLAQVGSWERHNESNRIDWSDEMFRIFALSGSPPPTVTDFIELVHPKDREKVLNSVDEVYSSTAPVELSYRIIRPDEEIRYVRAIVQAIRNDRGAPVRVVGAVQDVTDQVKTFELLRESEGRLRNAERLAHLGHWSWDLDSDHVSWSEEMFHIFGQPSDFTPSYDGFFEAVIPQDRERVRREVRDAIADHSGFSGEAQIVRPDGDLRTITFMAEVLLDEEGAFTGMFGATQDITEVRRAQRADFARQKLESIGRLAGGIAHDFNNLLGSVLVQAEVALRGLASGSSPEDELKTIREVAVRGSEIVRELMVYAGKESAVVELVDVSNVVKEMIELLKVSVSKHVVIETDLGKHVPFVRGNAAQLRQIVMNLVTNASDALGDRDGFIRLSTRFMRVDQDSEPDLLVKGEYTLLEVSDTGCGMTAETQAKIFDPFFTTKSAGHGLGLAIVDGIVRSLRGAIRLKSEPGKGSTFQILLPCAEAQPEDGGQPIPANKEVERPFSHATVLIVEDEHPLRQAVTKMLRKSGFEAFEAADGSSAIDILRANSANIDLILLDMTIPGAPSPEVVAEAAKLRPEIKVVLTSAYSQEMIAGTITAAQVRSFIRKPFQLRDLVKALQNTLAIS